MIRASYPTCDCTTARFCGQLVQKRVDFAVLLAAMQLRLKMGVCDEQLSGSCGVNEYCAGDFVSGSRA